MLGEKAGLRRAVRAPLSIKAKSVHTEPCRRRQQGDADVRAYQPCLSYFGTPGQRSSSRIASTNWSITSQMSASRVARKITLP
jgi:hypothetical protein